jgi:hypothetical protein
VSGGQVDAEVAVWNAALILGDPVLIAEVRREVLRLINQRIMNDDPHYRAAGWTA